MDTASVRIFVIATFLCSSCSSLALAEPPVDCAALFIPVTQEDQKQDLDLVYCFHDVPFLVACIPRVMLSEDGERGGISG